MTMKGSGGFTLIEVLVILFIISSLLAFSLIGTGRFRNALEFNNSVHQVLSDIKLTQQLAESSYKTCRIEFAAGKNTYTIIKGGDLFRSYAAGSSIRFSGKSYFSFAPSGCTDVGGSGTLSIKGESTTRNIIVSSKGRIRIE